MGPLFSTADTMSEETDQSQVNETMDGSENTETINNPDQVPNEAIPEEQKIFSIKVISPTGKELTLQTSLGDNVQDLKQMLFEAPEICHITSYSLEFNGETINDFAELKDLAGVEEGSVFTMKETPYSEFCSRLHVRRVRDLLSNRTEKPLSVLSTLTSQLEKEIAA